MITIRLSPISMNFGSVTPWQGDLTEPRWRLFLCWELEAAISGQFFGPAPWLQEQLCFMMLVCSVARDKSQVVLSSSKGGCTGEHDYKI